MMPQIRAAVRSCTAPGSGPDTHDVTVRADDDLQVHPVLAVLAGVKRPVGGDPADGDHGAVEDQVGVPGLAGVPQRLAQLRGPGRQQRHRLGDVPTGCGGADAEPDGRYGANLALRQFSSRIRRERL